MSFPSYSILCTQCDYDSSGRASHGSYYYKDDEGEFDLERQLGWCNGCQSITAIEDFGKTSKVASEIRSKLELISLKMAAVWANILNVLFKSRRAKEGGDLDVRGFMYHGERNTDFEHPGCGGTFYEKADNVRLHGKFEPRFYKPDGSYIEPYLES